MLRDKKISGFSPKIIADIYIDDKCINLKIGKIYEQKIVAIVPVRKGSKELKIKTLKIC